MRLIPSILAALLTLTTLAACGTKTPLSLPPQTPAAAKAAVAPAPTPAVDHNNKAAAEPRQ
jgi:predicted small lipoprotein YifL